MTRSSAREIAVVILFAQSFTGYPAEELLAQWLDASIYPTLASEDPIYARPPGDDAALFIRRLVTGVLERLPELDAHIRRYAVGWELERTPRTALAVMRAALFELIYTPDVPPAAAINAHLEIAKHYDTPEVVAYINGILGSFTRRESETP